MPLCVTDCFDAFNHHQLGANTMDSKGYGVLNGEFRFSTPPPPVSIKLHKYYFANFLQEGIGQLKIVSGGIQLHGQAVIMDMLRASTIRSRHGQPISIGKFPLHKSHNGHYK